MDSSLFRFIWRHSRREQIAILGLIVLSLPFYWGSLDIPKRIVNDALQGRAFKDGATTATLFDWSITLPGGRQVALSSGIALDRMEYLFALSGIFLLLVLINGAFKYAINVSKGVLGERMLRRLRYELLSLLLRFRPEEMQSVKPAEAATMIKDEVEPIGGFIGDAYIQPAFLGLQALTALLFIVVQNIWLGLVALLVVGLQALVVPRLRREQVRLSRERQLESRKLAGRVGEIVDGAPAIRTHGNASYNKAEVGSRLGRLYDIRVDLFKRKFAVKYLNNLLAQITPFFFFAIGGYFALKGSLDLGQLVAVIVAYRDLPPPIKELIDWDQQRMDVTVKYQQIIAQFPSGHLASDGAPATDEAVVRSSPIALDSLQVVDRLGSTVLEGASLVVEGPVHMALAGPAGSGREALAKAIGRQISQFRGSIRVDERNLVELSDESASRFLTYAGTEPNLFSGSVRDNIVFSLRRGSAQPDGAAEPLPAAERRRIEEARLSSNLILMPGHDWIDYAAAGAADAESLDLAILEVLKAVNFDDDVYKFGLLGRLNEAAEPILGARLVDARRTIRERLSARGLASLVEPFDPGCFVENASVGENLLFGVTAGKLLDPSNLASDPFLRATIEAEGLSAPLTEMGVKIAASTIEMFEGLSPGHPLFDRYSFIRAEDMEDYKRLLTSAPRGHAAQWLASGERDKFVALALTYIEPRHRFGLLDGGLMARIVSARARFRRELPTAYAGIIEFYDPHTYVMGAPVRDNLLFGRIALDQPNAEQQVWDVIRKLLIEIGLDKTIYRIGLGHEIGAGGKLIHARQRAAINLARCLVKRPDILVLDGALSAYDPPQAALVLQRIRALMRGRTLIATFADPSDAVGFDHVVTFDGARMTSPGLAAGRSAPGPFQAAGAKAGSPVIGS